MKLQQLRCLTEVARRGLNVSEAAEALHTSQPGVSKQIRALEDELGVQVFVRHGKRLVSVTEPGRAVVAIAERILAEAQNLRRAGEEFANDQLGTLTIAATHTQARYALPKAVAAFKRRYPKVELLIHQGNPTQICEQVLAGEADMGVATEMISLYPELVSLPVYQWNRCVVVPPKHALLRRPSRGQCRQARQRRARPPPQSRGCRGWRHPPRRGTSGCRLARRRRRAAPVDPSPSWDRCAESCCPGGPSLVRRR